MENQLFRKKSLATISSPEALHDYMRVTSPRLWMILGAIVILLAGFIVYASTVTMENTAPVQVELENYDVEDDGAIRRGTIVSGSVSKQQTDLVAPGMKIRLGSEEGTVTLVFSDEEDTKFLVEMEREYLNLPDGTYEAELVLESTTPISFLWN